MKALIVSIFCILLFAACKTKKEVIIKQEKIYISEEESTIKRPKNIVLMIGDGMGLGQITAGMYAQGNVTALEKFPVVGIHKPHSGSHLITDSAAGATAFSCGVKTYNGAIGIDMDSMDKTTILETAEILGYSTGLVATSTIVHATPASFIAHNVSRRNYEEIAEDFLETEIDYFVGGGKKYFDRREKDERDLLNELKSKNYDVYNYTEDFENCPTNLEKNYAYLTSDSDPLKADQGRAYLKPASTRALDYLSKKNDTGFFLMIEGSQIDWGGHANLSDYIISEFMDFDATVGAVQKWAMANQETLVIVTADHETGGYAIHHESTMDSLVTKFISTKHTGTMIPVFAYGPGSEHFSGIYDNTDIYHKMRLAMGWLDR